MPCNILVIDNEDGSTKIVFPDAESLLEITANQQVVYLAKEVDKLLKKAFDSIE